MTLKGSSCWAWRWMVREPDPSARRSSHALGGGGPGVATPLCEIGRWQPTEESDDEQQRLAVPKVGNWLKSGRRADESL